MVGTRFVFRLGVVALLGIGASRSAPAVAAPGDERVTAAFEEGALAPSHGWLQDDGCPARTGASAARALRGAVERVWKFSVKEGAIEGEPLAWKGRTFVVARAGNKRTVHVLSTVTGVEKFKQTFDSSLPLSPCLTDGRILLRTSPKTLQAFAVGEKSLTSRWTYSGKMSMGQPTVLRDEVYVVVDGVLARLTFGSSEFQWPKSAAAAIRVEGSSASSAAPAAGKSPAPAATGTEFPRPSLRGTSVFLAAGTRFVEVDRKDGSVRRETRLPEKADPRLSRVVVGLADVMVSCGVRFRDDGRDADTVRLGLADSGPFEKHPALLLPFGIASFGRDWVAAVGKGKAQALVVTLFNGTDTDTDDRRDIANATMHPEFLDAKVAPTTAGEIVFLGGRIFDAGSLELLHPDPVPCVSRVIPRLDRLVVVESKNRVTAWKSPVKTIEVPPLRLFGVAGKPSTLAAGRAVLDDGRLVAGAFSIDAKSGNLVCTGKTTDTGSWPLTAVRALLSDESPRQLLVASRPNEAADAVAAMARADSASELLALVPAAVESSDGALARKVQSAATDHGAPFLELAKSENPLPLQTEAVRPAELTSRTFERQKYRPHIAGACHTPVVRDHLKTEGNCSTVRLPRGRRQTQKSQQPT